MSVCISSHTTRLGGLVLFAGRLWGRVNDNHRGINLVSFGARNHDSVLKKFDHEKTVVTLDSFSEKVSSIPTMFSSGSSLGVHVMGSIVSSNS